MKETIYTIPINDAFDSDCKCPLCFLETKLENESLEYVVGASMMEPEFRINTNKKGFCKKHFANLHTISKALPLALVIETHIFEQQKILNKSFDKILSANKNAILKRSENQKHQALKFADEINELTSSCAVCERIETTMKKFIENTVYMWKKDDSFKEKFKLKCDFCLPHLSQILKFASEQLSSNEFNNFSEIVINTQKESIDKTYKNILAFSKMFDYNSDKNVSDEVKNVLPCSINKLSGNNLSSK